MMTIFIFGWTVPLSNEMHRNTVTAGVISMKYIHTELCFQTFRRARVARFSQQTSPNCYSKLAQSRFEGGPLVKIAFRWLINTRFFGGAPLVRFALQRLNITSLQPRVKNLISSYCNIIANAINCSACNCPDYFYSIQHIVIIVYFFFFFFFLTKYIQKFSTHSLSR